MAEDDEVGYGKPPLNTRWKPGQSGNPKGRPKEGGTGFVNLIAGILSEPVKAKTPDGASVSLGALEAAFLAICKKALNGDDAALYQTVKIILEIIPAGEQKQSERAASNADSRRKLARLMGISLED